MSNLPCVDTTIPFPVLGVPVEKSCKGYADDNQCNRELLNQPNKVYEFCPKACAVDETTETFGVQDVEGLQSCKEFAKGNHCTKYLVKERYTKVYEVCPRSCYGNCEGTKDEKDDDDVSAVDEAPVKQRQNQSPPPEKKDNNNDDEIKGSSSVSRFHSIGFQSNWGDQSSYSGSMVYDFTRNTVYVTGTTYQKDQIPVQSSSGEQLPQRSTCFVGQIPIVNIVEHWKLDDPPLPPRSSDNPTDFVVPDSLMTTEQMGCNAILYDSGVIGKYGADYLYVGGVDETPMDNERNGEIAAFVNLYTRNSNSINWTNKRKDSSSAVPHMADMEHPCPVKYPVAMDYGFDSFADSGKGKAEIAVLNVASHDPLMTNAFIENGDVENMKINHKNSLLPPGLGTKSDPLRKDYHKRGSAFYFTLQRFTLDDEECDKRGNNCKKVVQWKSEHVINEQSDPSNSDADILPTGLINLGGITNNLHYVVVGSYHGRFYINDDKHYGWKMTSLDNDYDGFMQSLTFSSGKPTWQPISTFSSIENSPSNLNDYIHDVCKGYDPVTGNVNSIYVVGSTFGTMPKGSIQTPDDEQPDENISLPQGKVASKEYNSANHKTLSAWVSRVDIDTLKPIWTTQLYGTKHAEAFGCHVIPSEPTLMYVGGTVYEGGEMMYVRSGSYSKIRKGKSSGNSAGKDDVWVTQLDTRNGSLRWIKQLGSSGNDQISRTNGVAADLEGDCIIYGETDGDLYRSKKADIDPTHTDIFLVQLDKIDGRYRTTTEIDKKQKEEMNKKSAIIGGMVGIIVVLLAVIMAVFFFKVRRSSPAAVRRRRKTVEDVEMSDGVFTDDPELIKKSYKDEDPHGDSDGEYNDPSQKQFSIDDEGNYVDKGAIAVDDGDTASKRIREATIATTTNVGGFGDGEVEGQDLSHPNDILEEQQNLPDQSTFKDDPDYRPGRNFV